MARTPKRLRGYAMASILVFVLLAVMGAIMVQYVFQAFTATQGWLAGKAETYSSDGAYIAWTKWVLSSDPNTLTLSDPLASVQLPEDDEPRGTLRLVNGIGRSSVFGPGEPIPPGLKAGLYAAALDSFSSSGTTDFRPVALGSLVADWDASPEDPGSGTWGSVSPGGLFEAIEAGDVTVKAPSFSSGESRLTAGIPEDLVVSITPTPPADGHIGISPLVAEVDSVRPFPITAIWYGPSPRQLVPPTDTFEIVSGPGTLTPEHWGVTYNPTEPGAVTIKVSTTEYGVPLEETMTFNVVAPEKLCVLLMEKENGQTMEVWLRNKGERTAVLSRYYQNGQQ